MLIHSIQGIDCIHQQTVLIVGLGESGLACIEFAHTCQARQIIVADSRLTPPNLIAVQSLPNITLLLGDFSTTLSLTILKDLSCVVISPGITPHQAQPVLDLIHTLNIERNGLNPIAVYSELDWFHLALQSLNQTLDYKPAVLGITGTNGKTTVTELTTHLCNEAGLSAIACGNISPAALTALLLALKNNQNVTDLPRVWVLELSSFQLHYTKTLALTAGTLLNITQDHLDWHDTMADYAQDKLRLFRACHTCILNRDDSVVMSLKPCLNKPNQLIKIIKTFGLNQPINIGDMGCIDQGLLWLTTLNDTGLLNPLLPAHALRLRGQHNYANAMAAILLAQAAGVSIEDSSIGLRTYTGAPNRCELVKIIDDVEYINDSKGTNVGATVAALMGLSDNRQRLILILGGVGKGQDFSPLIQPITHYCKAVILIGESAHIIANTLESALTLNHISLSYAVDLNDAVKQGANFATVGDAVLLSPACSSFDMFKHYAHRALVFVDSVKAYSLSRGYID